MRRSVTHLARVTALAMVTLPAPASQGPADEPLAVIELPAEPLPEAESEPAELAPLVVVGSRDPREIEDLAASVSVVSAREIEFQGASSLGQVLGQLPGVAVEGGPRANAEFINIRGLSGPRVLLIVDGARQNFLGGHRSSLMVDPDMLKQVELLRGPASALWGSDALGGVVVLATKDARDFLEDGQRAGGRIRLGIDSVDNERLGSAIGALRVGDFDVVASALQRDADDYRRGDGQREPHTQQRADSTLAKLSWLPRSGPHSVSLVRQGFVQSGRSPSNPANRLTDTNPLLDRENDVAYSVARYGYEHDAGWLRSAQLNLYRDEVHIREERVDAPRSDHSFFRTDGLGAHLSMAPSWLQGSLLSLGTDGFRDRSRATRDGAPRPQFPDAERQLVGSFLQLEVPLGAFSLLPGIRYDRYRSRTRQTDDPDVVESAISPKFGLVYRLAEGVRLRAAYNSAFRAPGLVEIYAAGQHFLGNDFVPNPDLKPEQARNLELGFSADLPGFAPGQQVHISGSLYRNRIRDFIELYVIEESEFPAPRCLRPAPPVGCVNRNEEGLIDPTVPPVFVGGITSSRNLASATVQGGEIEATYRLGPLRLGASYSRTRGRDDSSGAPLSSIAADRLRSSLDWRAPFVSDLNATLSHTRHFAQDRVPTFEDENGETQNLIPTTPANGVWDFGLSWEPFGADGQRFGIVAPRLVLGIDNLGNESYRQHLNVLPSPGRSYRASLSFGF